MATILRLVAVAAAAVSLATPALAHGDPPPASGWMITRTAAGPAIFTGTLSATAADAEATALVFALRGVGGNRTADGAFSTTRIDWGMDGWPRVYGDGVPSPSCVGSTCADPVRTRVSIHVSSNGHAIESTILVAGWHVGSSSVAVDSPGWRVRPWRPTMRVARIDENGTGARAVHATVGRFEGASLPGGTRGSFAWATLPCGYVADGSARFTGGRRAYELACGSGRSKATTAAGATRWRMTGEAIGDGGTINPLVVVDFPR